MFDRICLYYMGWFWICVHHDKLFLGFWQCWGVERWTLRALQRCVLLLTLELILILVGGFNHFLFSIIYGYIWDNHPNWLIFFTRGWNHQPGYVMIHSWYVIIPHHPSQAGMLPRFLSSKKVWPEHASDECCAHWESWHGKHKENACDKALHDSQCLWMSMVNDILRGWPCRSSRRLSHVVSLETFTILGWSGFWFQTTISTWRIHRALISTDWPWWFCVVLGSPLVN